MFNFNQIQIVKLKRALREAVKEKQALLTREYIEYADEQICRNILAMDEYKNARAVFCFVGTKTEISTKMILKQILSDGKKLLVPKCRKNEKGMMDVFEITGLDQLEVGTYGILEPREESSLMVDASEIDFAVIPCLSCDKKGHRLGHGGGYYDRYLAKNSGDNEKSFQKVVISREKLIEDLIPCEETDQKMDFVVTEKGVFKIG